MRKYLLAGVAAAAIGGFALAPAAHAGLISVGLQEAGTNGGAITTVATGAAGVGGVIGLAYGSFTVNNISASDNQVLGNPDVLFSNSLNTSASTPATLTVFITSQNNTFPAGTSTSTSSFTSNSLTPGWTVTESTLYSAANGLYTGTLANTATFTALGTDVKSAMVAFGSPYSVTHEYVITSTGIGTANSTINTSVPEPGSLALLGTALAALGFVGWSMKKRRVA